MDAVPFSVTPLSAHTGAEITGVDLRSPVDGENRDRLDQAFRDYAVVAVRDQQLSAAQFLEAMKIFGDIFWQHNPRFAVPECPQIHYISNQDTLDDGRVYIPGEGYHTDRSNDVEPPKATALHAVKLPKTGGDTQFVNMCEAYEALPEALKERINYLQARHVLPEPTQRAETSATHRRAKENHFRVGRAPIGQDVSGNGSQGALHQCYPH